MSFKEKLPNHPRVAKRRQESKSVQFKRAHLPPPLLLDVPHTAPTPLWMFLTLPPTPLWMFLTLPPTPLWMFLTLPPPLSGCSSHCPPPLSDVPHTAPHPSLDALPPPTTSDKESSSCEAVVATPSHDRNGSLEPHCGNGHYDDMPAKRCRTEAEPPEPSRTLTTLQQENK
ncbi:uncharacterized protein [Salvelinus sp. IW2-2015]|uniref:uncharacterized protein n=1 Tax=Salvelinus sp. IW2-2015 TaxID=2691554 RepID=UPI0038D3E752